MGAYFNHKFWAGMTTTQRAESMNAFLRNFLTRKSTLGQFVYFLWWKDSSQATREEIINIDASILKE